MRRLCRSLVIILAASTNLAAPSLAEPLARSDCTFTSKLLLRELTKGYERKYGVTFEFADEGPNQATRDSSHNTVAISDACHANRNERTAASQAQRNPVAWDALAVIVHPDNPITNLSLVQLREIYDGRIVNWRQLGGDDKPLELQVRRDKHSGIGLALRKRAFRAPGRDFIAAAVHPSSDLLEHAVEHNPNAIAVAAIDEVRKRHVKVLSLENKTASYNSIRSGAYRLYRPLYIAYQAGTPQRAEVERFITYAHSQEGRAIIRAQGAVPYLEALNLVDRQHGKWQTGRGS